MPRFGRLWLAGAAMAVASLAYPARADEFVSFFQHQKIGQEIKVQGPFRRESYKRHLFKKNSTTGKVEHYDLFATVILPTALVGSGSLKQEPDRLDVLLAFYPDETLVIHLPEQGEGVWFIGTLLGYQYGREAVTDDVGTGGMPYLLLESVERAADEPQGRGGRPAP